MSRAPQLGRALLRVIAAAAVALATALPAAADEGWTIERFNIFVRVQPDATLVITESIDVDFGALQKHGIFRSIPVRYRYDDRYDRVYDLRVRAVTDAGGKAWRYERTDEDAYAIVKIGDPDRTISGKQSYRIVYELGGALNAFADHDELYWNVSGDQWPVPIRSSGAHVQLERGTVTQVACYQGFTGSTDPCRSSKTGGAADFMSTRPLREGEQITIVAGFPKGAVAEPQKKLEARPRDIDAWWDLTPGSVGGALIVLVGGLALVGRRYLVTGRDPGGPTTVVPEYEPPAKLKPAEVGLLVDEVADPKDLTATIVDLAVRGYLRIEELPAKGPFGLGGKDWKLVQLPGGKGDLAPYETVLYTGLFAAGPEVKVSDLRGTFHSTLASAEADLYKASVAGGWFLADPSRVRALWLGIGCAALVFGAAGGILLGIFYGSAIVGAAAILVGAIVVVASRAMPSRTKAGRDLLWHITGFRRYMETAETDRQRFAERENIFASYLPYAIVFGLVTKWANAFKDLDVVKATQGWYSGSSLMNIPMFSNDLAGFSSGLSTAISTSPPSTGGGSGSSGFGGGGGSGGGGGGGGGGSW